MPSSKFRQVTLRTLLSLTTSAGFVLGFVHLKRQQAIAIREAKRAEYYAETFKKRTGSFGYPMVNVVAADTLEPVANVVLEMTLIGPDGGDGGFQCFVTDESGVAFIHQRLPDGRTWHLNPGRYQYGLVPSPDSRFRDTQWKRGQPYVVVAADGKTSVPTLKLQVKKN